MSTEPDRTDDPRKILAAGLVKRLVALCDRGASLEDWNDVYADTVANVASRLRQRFGPGDQPWIDSAAASAMRTVLRRVVAKDAPDQTDLPLRPTGPDALLGLLVLIAFDKVYEKKIRDNDDENPSVSTAEREDEEQKRLVDEAIRDEMDRQLNILLARLCLLGGGQKTLVYRLLIEKEAGIADRSYEQIRALAGVTAYSLRKARWGREVWTRHDRCCPAGLRQSGATPPMRELSDE